MLTVAAIFSVQFVTDFVFSELPAHLKSKANNSENKKPMRLSVLFPQILVQYMVSIYYILLGILRNTLYSCITLKG